MKSRLLASLISVAALMAVDMAPANAKPAPRDVQVFSKSEAEEVLADETDDCPVRLPNGSCARTSGERGFRLAEPPGKSKVAPPVQRSTPSTSTTYARPSKSRSPAPSSASRLAKPREVPLQFALGSYELSPQSKVNLQNLASVLNASEHRTKRIKVTGHTDRTGSLEINTRLSQQRADAVSNYLVQLGVERGRVEAEGRAYRDLLPGVSATNPRNRRVEVVRVE